MIEGKKKFNTMKICKIKDCNNKHICKNLCRKHYDEIYRKKYRMEHENEISKYDKQYHEQYYLKNKNKIKKTNKQYYQENKEKILKRLKQYNLNNKEQKLKYARQYYFDNKEKITIRAREYEQTSTGKAIRKASAHKGLTKETVQRVYEDNIAKYGILTCYLCFEPVVNNDDCLEHSTPLSRGGNNEYENLGIAHQSCNNQKHTMTLGEWYKKNAK